MSEPEPKPKRPHLFRRFYEWVMHFSATPHATTAAMIVVFLSPGVIPLPPDILLIPVLLSKPDKVLRLGLLASLLYALGWIAGYGIGFYGHQLFGADMAARFGLTEFIEDLRVRYEDWGAWAVVLGSATPLSDKVFSIGSGILRYDFGKFVLFATLGAFIRIMGMAILLKIFGPAIARFVDKKFEWVLFGVLGVLLIAWLVIRSI